ncbi:hypothetical protein NCS55_00878300 [Fusarium keratoplasticum]|nr:hypothetical protein NCS55_00878300 [Fusarium keratoplasticum]
MDGLPTGDVGFDRRYPSVFGEHPIDSDHEELCPGAMERAHEYYKQWNPKILMFDPRVCFVTGTVYFFGVNTTWVIAGYQLAEFGSKAFNVRLVELAAVTLHQGGALLFQLDLRIHQGDTDSIVNWRMPPIEGLVDVPPRPTLFNHHAYLDADIYPEGVDDIVGYWAEERILGGVAVFDRGAEDVAATPNIYFYSCRRRQTHRVYQLRDDQQKALFNFLLAETDSPPSEPNSLPVLGNAQNRIRVDSEVAITHHNIYRDIWERKPLAIEEELTMER